MTAALVCTVPDKARLYCIGEYEREVVIDPTSSQRSDLRACRSIYDADDQANLRVNPVSRRGGIRDGALESHQKHERQAATEVGSTVARQTPVMGSSWRDDRHELRSQAASPTFQCAGPPGTGTVGTVGGCAGDGSGIGPGAGTVGSGRDGGSPIGNG